ncbi:transketolase [Candidatus Nanopelagicus abundans]|uniref:Transketolase n=1 Tax=Candidatus Nanopelagicus abundans TaxID=1884916 RepID=A0A249L4S9_9ACTN|nr:transketolase [Candidatus Nanopelagicus abundans]ASY23929.1 transketolase [Candidatus Nanopelagicus abundans]
MKISQWQDLDDRAVAISRALAMDAAQKVGNGHPGTAMSLAPVAYTLFQRIMRHDPAHPNWLARDRFILSCGHSSLTLYIQLYLSGYGVELDDLKSFRTFNAKTPGHPEYGHTLGVETTTGPLGQGVANGVGMAMAARFEKGLLDPENTTDIFDHNIWVMCSDGDLQEGVSAEASSLAGTQQLGNLIMIYDDNRISIEGDTHITCTEDIDARYLAYGWDVIVVPIKADGDVDRENLERAMLSAIANKDKPVLIHIHTVIAWPAPNAKGTSKAHGSALGNEEINATKLLLGLNPEETFIAPTEVINHARDVKRRGTEMYNQWQTKFQAWEKANSESAELLKRLLSKKLPLDFESSFPVFPSDKEISTRAASGKVIQSIAKMLPEFWGGSADLAESNNTTIEGGGSFLPTASKMAGADPYGRIIHFGIREHAMGAILNGMALHGLVKPFGGTFLVFSDYMRGAVRLSSLMQLPVTYVWTHDSIGLGEDGPTHQPVEHLASLRTIPGFSVIRPCDANEVSVCWQEIIKRSKPSGLVLSRQNLPVLDRSKFSLAKEAAKGAYVLAYGSNSSRDECEVILIATGSEVSLAIAAREKLISEGVKVRLVSAPCLEWFMEQSENYQNEVLPKSIKARVSIEAGVAQPWYRFIGDSGIAVSVEKFGASASGDIMFREYGFTVQNIVNAVKESIKKSNA